MGILGVGINTSGGVSGFLRNPFTREPEGRPREADFKEGFLIEEIPEEGIGVKITLVGNQLPHVPFEFGGSQHATKEYYAGNPEPNIQVLGARENDVTIKGRFFSKRFKDQIAGIPGADALKGTLDAAFDKLGRPSLNLRELPTKLAEEIDAIRIRGHLCKFKLGEWVRYGLLAETKWSMKDLGDIDYEITLLIMSFDEPRLKTPIVTGAKLIPIELKSDLSSLSASLAADAENRQIPDAVPTSIAELLNSITGSVAGVVTGVLDFVDGIIATGEEITDSVSRAVGIIKNAEAEVSRNFYRLGRISYNLSFAGVPIPERYSTSNIISSRMSFFNDINDVLKKMRARFEQFRETVPQARRRVKEGDTLQKLSIEFYGSDEHWLTIYTHNKLTSTDLEDIKGVVLEIPKL